MLCSMCQQHTTYFCTRSPESVFCLCEQCFNKQKLMFQEPIKLGFVICIESDISLVFNMLSDYGVLIGHLRTLPPETLIYIADSGPFVLWIEYSGFKFLCEQWSKGDASGIENFEITRN